MRLRRKKPPDPLKPTLFRFILAHSLRRQLALLAVTLLTFPLLYAQLELPKLIINDAIEAPPGPVTVPLLGVEMDRKGYLLVLCGCFLAAVLAGGVAKMRLNTMKGVVAEGLLQRFRRALIARMMRFPLPHFKRVSQGELVSMVTAEAEPLGGLMGDAIAHPVFQAGQMLTIVAFLFIQNVWLGVAAVALIPLQAWLVPWLQRAINRLHRARVREVRKLSGQLSEGAAGVADLRAGGGVRPAMAAFDDRLGRLFDIRHDIYRRKFFLKFVSNLITQLTPLAFFAIGGWLAIDGELSVGALVAALAAHKDLSAPWRELLSYVTRVQELTERYRIIVRRFAPDGMLDAALFEGSAPAEAPRLDGDVALRRLTVSDASGAPVLDGIDLTLAGGTTVGVASASAVERAALAQALARLVVPDGGAVSVGGHDLATLHQDAVAARIGLVTATPVLFGGTVRENVTLGLDEGARDDDALRDWWLTLIEALGADGALFEAALGQKARAADHPELTAALLALRAPLAERLAREGLDRTFRPLEPDAFNPGLAIGGNLLFAAPLIRLDATRMARDPRFLSGVREIGLEAELTALARAIVGLLVATFGEGGGEHPLLRRIGLSGETFEALRESALEDDAALEDEARALLMAVPFCVAAEEIGPDFPARLAEQVLTLRRGRRAELRRRARDVFAPLDPRAWCDGLTVLENLLFGIPAKVPRMARTREVVAEAIEAAGLRGRVTLLMGEVEAGVGGADIGPVARERIALSRAAIKRPDLLVLEGALPSMAAQDRRAVRRRLRALLPETTMVWIEAEIDGDEGFDHVVRLRDGRLVEDAAKPGADASDGDMAARLQALAAVPLFSRMPQEQLRVLAFASRRFEVPAGATLFRAGDVADGAYLLLSGHGALFKPGMPESAGPVGQVPPGRLVGDIAFIRGTARHLDFVATEPSTGLHVAAEDFVDAMEADPAVAIGLLRATADNMADLGERLVEARREVEVLRAEAARQGTAAE